MRPDDVRHDIGISVELYHAGTVSRITGGNIAVTCGAGDIHDEEANAVRLAEQMVRELFRRRRKQLGMEF